MLWSLECTDSEQHLQQGSVCEPKSAATGDANSKNQLYRAEGYKSLARYSPRRHKVMGCLPSTEKLNKTMLNRKEIVQMDLSHSNL